MHRQRDHRGWEALVRTPTFGSRAQTIAHAPGGGPVASGARGGPLDAAHTREARGSGEKAGALRRPVPRHRRRSMPGGST
eukprot:scaffold27268_cov110-Isochrysis_galbana.AAC.3